MHVWITLFFSGYKIKLVMPSNMTEERKASMAAYGAELITVEAGQMEVARDLALAMQAKGEGIVLDQVNRGSLVISWD